MAYRQVDSLLFAGSDILEALIEKRLDKTISEIRIALMTADEVASADFSRLTYESYFAYGVKHGLDWKARPIVAGKTINSVTFLKDPHDLFKSLLVLHSNYSFEEIAVKE